MSRTTYQHQQSGERLPDADPSGSVLTPAWEHLVHDWAKLTWKRRRERMASLSYQHQLQAWDAIGRQYPTHEQSAESAMDAIVKRLAKIEKRVPGGAWADDAKSLPQQAGGAFPPGGKQTLMRRAKGERRLYPPQYLTSSGHCWDAWMQKVYLGRVQHLLPERGDDGYRGSVISVRDLPAADQRRFHRTDELMRGDRGTRTNSINLPAFDGIND